MRLEPNWPTLVQEYQHDSLDRCRILVCEWSDRTYTAYIERDKVVLEDGDTIWDKYPTDDELLDLIEEQ